MSWETVRFEEIIDVRDGTHDSPKYVSTGFPLVTSKNIIKGQLDCTTVNYITKEDYDKINQRSKVDIGDIIMPMIGTIGNPYLVEREPNFAIKNVALFKINRSRLYNKMLLYLLNSSIVKQQLLNNSRGGTQKFVSLKNLRGLKIPLPPLETQEQIVDLLDRAQALTDKRKEQITLMDQLIQSLFYDMFGDPVTNPMGWDVRKLEDCIVGKPSNGFFAKNDIYSEDGDTGVIWIGDFINQFYCTLNGLRKVNASEKDKKKYSVQYGDILFCRSSLTVEGIGKTACVPKTDTPVLFECHIIRVSLNTNLIVPEFFKVLSDTSFFRSQIMRYAKTATMTTIGQKGVVACNVLIPPLPQQIVFMNHLEKIKAQKEAMTTSLQELENNFNSIMQRAFKGEL